MVSRRQFIQRSASAVAAGLVMPTIVRAENLFSGMAPSDQINVALIGCRSMGWSDLNSVMSHEGVNCVALCDVDRSVLERRGADAEKKWNRKPDLYSDYRRVLERQDIDAVIVGTPDHWHCLIMTDACSAGKDVYVEKPIGHSIAECDAMVAAAERYGRVVEVGQQKHSADHWQAMKKYIDSGKLGKIARVNVWANFSYGAMLDPGQETAVPEGVDFDMWLGPAPKRSFNPVRFHGSWRMFWDYGGGILTDMGPHLLDMALWCMNVKGMPKRVMAMGGNFAYPKNICETFDTMQVGYDFDDFNLQWSHVSIPSGPYNQHNGLEFKGTNGTLVTNYEKWEVLPEGDKTEHMLVKATNDDHAVHTQNFLDCIRTRNVVTSCTIQHGSLCAKYAHLGNISLRTGEVLTYDDQHHTFHNKAADKLVKPEYRKPWKFPKY